MKIEFPGQILEKFQNMKFRESFSNGRYVVPRGKKEWETDELAEVNSRF
jgi:hypothetical protein